MDTSNKKTLFPPAFNSFMAQSWSDFLTSNPKAAELLIITKRLLAATVLAQGVFVVLIAWKSHSKAEKWSWYTLLVAGIIGWGSALTYHIVIGYLMAVVIPIVGIVVFIIGIVPPA